MPAFTFEKISPPRTSNGPVAGVTGAAPAIEKKQRGAIIQILGRFVERRVDRAQRVEKRVTARRERRETD